MNKKGVYLDDNCIQLAGYLRSQMGILAEALINEGKNKKAKEVLDKCMAEIPEENIPYDGTIVAICNSYYRVKKTKLANELAKKLFEIYEGDLKIYKAQKESYIYVYEGQIKEAEDVLKNLLDLTKEFNQEESCVLMRECLEPCSKILFFEKNQTK